MLMSFALFLIGIGANGPKTLIGVSVREIVSENTVGLAGGLLGIVGQIGGAAAGIAIGYLLQNFGWGVYIPILGMSVIVSGILLLTYVIIFSNKNISNKKNK